MSLTIMKPGLLTTVQDLGRDGYQQQGVIVSGAMDRYALRMANLLTGNTQGMAALEVTMWGPAIQFEQASLVAICGAPFEPRINGRIVPLWRPVWVRAGEILEFGSCSSGARAYLAVAGGVDVPLVLGSRSTYLRAQIGGHEGRALLAGDVLPIGEPSSLAASYMANIEPELTASPFTAASWFIGELNRPAYHEEPLVRFVRGREYHQFTEASKEAFTSHRFRVSSQSDRMGYRLEGPDIQMDNRVELLSSAVVFGTVQVPPQGSPIILMADRQTVGGYPRIAQVASVDLPILAQVRPGDWIRFDEITLEEAEQMYSLAEQLMRRLECAIGLYLKQGGL